MTHARHWAGLAAAAVLMAILGCEGGGAPSVSSSTEQVQVKGKVTLKGKPVTSGKVQFDASNINRRDAPTATLELQKDGTYSGTTLIGENSVSVVSPQLNTADLTANRKEVVLTSGENTVDISLPQ